MRSFIGFTSYYRQFIQNFTSVAGALHQLVNSCLRELKLTSKLEVPFVKRWDKSCQESFETLKQKLMTAPVLGYANFEKPFVVEVDVSLQGLGAVLSQEQMHGKRRVIDMLAEVFIRQRKICKIIAREFFISGKTPSSKERKALSRSVLVLLRQQAKIQDEDGILYRTLQYPGEGAVRQLLLPCVLKSKVISCLHDDLGHQGVERTIQLIRKRCFWPGMYQDVSLWIKKCQRCILGKMPNPRVKPHLGSIIAQKPSEVLAIDYTLFEKSSDVEQMY